MNGVRQVMVNKDLGQVFTPLETVKFMLDEINYVSGNPKILVSTILEPSFGRGVFLKEIVRRLIVCGESNGLTSEEISAVIQNNVWGVELDESLHIETIDELNALVESQGLTVKAWNVFQQDALTFVHDEGFDFVVGNPPYIRVHNMGPVLREAVKKFKLSTGTTDLYVIFFELGISLLNPTGKLIYITPNSYHKNTSQKHFRKHLLEGNLISKIVDYRSKEQFFGAATYTAITLVDAHKENKLFTYSSFDATGGYVLNLCVDDFTDVNGLFSGDPWTFTNNADYAFISEVANREHKLGDMCNVQYGVETMRNKIFGNTHGQDFEPGVLRDAIKGSTYKGEVFNEQLIFPYKFNEVTQKFVTLTETELSVEYPKVYAYLLANKEELCLRDIDKNASWFQYGRSQGIANVGKKKLAFSHVIRKDQKTIAVFEIPENVIIYSGIYTTVIDGGKTLEELKTIFSSEEFCRFAKISGKDMSGGFKKINSKVMKNYGLLN